MVNMLNLFWTTTPSPNAFQKMTLYSKIQSEELPSTSGAPPFRILVDFIHKYTAKKGDSTELSPFNVIELLLHQHNLPCGFIAAGLNTIEIDTRRDPSSRLVASVPQN